MNDLPFTTAPCVVPGNATLPSGCLNDANLEDGVSADSSEPKGWHSRGYLPHFDGQEVIQHVTFHLADSLPKDVLIRLEDEVKGLPTEKQATERRKRIETWIDAGHGSCLLQDPSAADTVQNSLLFFDGERYRVLAWVVMPNHVHVLFQPINGWAVSSIVTSWKKFTATRIYAMHKAFAFEKLSHKTGDESKHLWHREYWDRFIRDHRHFDQTVMYIHQNPVKAHLVARPEDWPWSSASNVRQRATQESGVPGAKP